VRELGTMLGLPKNIINRHPFPGPGLAIRCLCLKKPDSIDEKRINKEIARILPSGYSGCVVPIKSVGVQGDNRTYRYFSIISGKLDWKTLKEIATRIVNDIEEINRVTYLIYPSKIPEFKFKTNAYITKARLELLRKAHSIVAEKTKHINGIWQFPVVLVPFGVKNGETIVLRPISSKEAMTADVFELQHELLHDVAGSIVSLGIDMVLYDITSKPPATIEWE